MNKNTTILLGAIAVIAIGAGAYVSMSKPANEGFATQSFRKTVQSQPTTTVTDGGNEDGGDGDVAGKPIVKYNSDATCSVTFDDGVTLQGDSISSKMGLCCDLQRSNHDGCYSGRETGVSGINFGTQPAEKKVIDNFTTQSARKNTQKTISNTKIGINDNQEDDVMGITINYNSDSTCSVTFDDGVTRTGETDYYGVSGRPCCKIKSHDTCYNGRETGVSGVNFGTQPAEKKVVDSFTTQSARKNTQKTISNTKIGINDNQEDDVMGITVKINSDRTCSVTFDDGVTLQGTASKYIDGKPCCGEIPGQDSNICYSGRETGVAGVNYGTQPAEKKVMAEENYYE